MSRIIKLLLAIVLPVLFLGNFSAYPETDFGEKINSLKWVAYSPTNFDPARNQYPVLDSIKEDLAVLYNAGFNGIVTYGSLGSLALIPKLAKEAGFQGVIMGIWDLNDSAEIENAVKMLDYADAYCVGNEGLNSRYTLGELRAVIAEIKTMTRKPVTTTEQIDDYGNEDLLEAGDWLFPNVHPFFHNIKTPLEAAAWIKNWYRVAKKNGDRLNKPVLFKEVGYPTKGEPVCCKSNQKKLFSAMEKSGVKFVYFEAFDQHWKRDLPVEPYWGLFDRYRKPKTFIADKIKERKNAASKLR